MAPMTCTFVAGIEVFCQREGVNLVCFQQGERMDDRALECPARHPGGGGVLFVKIEEKARVLCTQAPGYPVTKRRNLGLAPPNALPIAYYVYVFDDDFGPLLVEFCSYFPDNAKLYLNGHEYLKRQLRKRGIPFQALDDGLHSCA